MNSDAVGANAKPKKLRHPFLGLSAQVIIGIGIAAAIILVAHIYLVSHQKQFINGYVDINARPLDLTRPVLMVVAVVIGMLSSALFNALTSTKFTTLAALSTALAARSFIIASIIAPIVIAGVYDKLNDIHSNVVLFLFAYQNGFLWESLISPIRRS
jgi:hypothetical protein